MENSFKSMANSVQANQELLNKVKQHIPEHPALNRMRSKIMQNSESQSITDYSRMHHRHNRS